MAFYPAFFLLNKMENTVLLGKIMPSDYYPSTRSCLTQVVSYFLYNGQAVLQTRDNFLFSKNFIYSYELNKILLLRDSLGNFLFINKDFLSTKSKELPVYCAKLQRVLKRSKGEIFNSFGGYIIFSPEITFKDLSLEFNLKINSPDDIQEVGKNIYTLKNLNYE